MVTNTATKTTEEAVPLGMVKCQICGKVCEMLFLCEGSPLARCSSCVALWRARKAKRGTNER